MGRVAAAAACACTCQYGQWLRHPVLPTSCLSHPTFLCPAPPFLAAGMASPRTAASALLASPQQHFQQQHHQQQHQQSMPLEQQHQQSMTLEQMAAMQAAQNMGLHYSGVWVCLAVCGASLPSGLSAGASPSLPSLFNHLPVQPTPADSPRAAAPCCCRRVQRWRLPASSRGKGLAPEHRERPLELRHRCCPDRIPQQQRCQCGGWQWGPAGCGCSGSHVAAWGSSAAAAAGTAAAHAAAGAATARAAVGRRGAASSNSTSSAKCLAPSVCT